MMNYQSLQRSYPPAFTPINGQSPYKMGGSHADVYDMLTAQNTASLGAVRNRLSTDFQNERLAAQQNSALAGLQNLVQARNNQMDLANQRRSMQLGAVNNILSGLFR